MTALERLLNYDYENLTNDAIGLFQSITIEHGSIGTTENLSRRNTILGIIGSNRKDPMFYVTVFRSYY